MNGGVDIAAYDKREKQFIQSFVTDNYYSLRILAGLTTNELAELTGTTRQTINSIESGKTVKMNSTLVVATKSELSKIADSNKDNRLSLALLKIAIDLLFNLRYPSGQLLAAYEVISVSSAFLAVAKIMEIQHRFTEDALDKLSEAIFRTMLNGELYEKTGLADFFANRQKENEQF